MFRNILFLLFIQVHVRSGKHGMHIYFCTFSMYHQWLLLIFLLFYVWYVLLLIISAYVILFEIQSKIYPGKYNPNFTYWFVIRTFSQNIRKIQIIFIYPTITYIVQLVFKMYFKWTKCILNLYNNKKKFLFSYTNVLIISLQLNSRTTLGYWFLI